MTKKQLDVNIDLDVFKDVREKVEALNTHLSIVLRDFILNHYTPSENLKRKSPRMHKISINLDLMLMINIYIKLMK
ncbi:hypothetical protein OE903_23270 [Bacillus sp. B6(2022)]|uniref:hypothetical protein n=1 Tax=Bacillus pumilus TaxID=1408 RepID=UPI0037EC08A1|nr:hypothetical protein [Bacillus sp. B6(2022)]